MKAKKRIKTSVLVVLMYILVIMLAKAMIIDHSQNMIVVFSLCWSLAYVLIVVLKRFS